MDDDLPPITPERVADKQAAGEKSRDEEFHHPAQDTKCANGEKTTRGKSFFTIFFATVEGIAIVFWMLSESFSYTHTVFLYLAIVCGLAGPTHLLAQKAFNGSKSFAIWSSYFLICCLIGVAKYKNSTSSVVTPSTPMVEVKIPKWLPPELPPDCTNVFASFGGEQMMLPMFLARATSEKTGTKFQLKELPPELTNGYEKLPGYTPSSSNLWLKLSDVKTTIDGHTVNFPVVPYVKDNRLFVFVYLPYQNGRHMIYMSDDMDSQIPPKWDRNYSSNAFEVVREDGMPVLQVFYKRSNEVQVNGIFIVNEYEIYESFGSTPLLISPRIRVTYSNAEPQEFNIKEFEKQFTNASIIVDTNAAYGTKFTDQKPIFKYPAWKYPGQYAN